MDDRDEPPRDIGVHHAAPADIPPLTWYAILKLRSDVFLVDGRSALPDLDGRDVEPTTVHLWAERRGRVLATLRVVGDRDGAARIGRLCTAPGERGAGLATRLVTEALRHAAGRTVRVNARAELRGWYADFGFAPDGPPYGGPGDTHRPLSRPPHP